MRYAAGSFRRGGKATNGGGKLSSHGETSWFAAFRSSFWPNSDRLKVEGDRRDLAVVVVVRFWCWPTTVIVGKRDVGEREGNGREKPQSYGFFF